MIQVPSFLVKLGSKAGVWFTKHGPSIMSIGGGAMAVGGAVMACKATLHAEEVLKVHREKMNTIALAKKTSDEAVENDEIMYGDEIYSEKMMKHDKFLVYMDTAKSFAKLYAPAVGLGLGGLGLMHGAFRIMKGEHGKAIAALTALEQAHSALLSRTAEMGVNALPESLPATVVDISDEESIDETKQVIVDPDATYDPFFFIFDAANPNWCGGNGFLLNERFLTAAVDNLNYCLQGKAVDHYWVNDLLKIWDMPETDLGHFHGWNGMTGDVIEYELTPYIYGDDLVLHPTDMDKLREMELQDVQSGYCIGIRLMSSSDGHDDLCQPRMIYNEVYGK